MSDRVAVMYLGSVVELADSLKIYEDPRHPYTQALIAAIPRTDPSRRAERIPFTGEIPSPLDLPSRLPLPPQLSPPHRSLRSREARAAGDRSRPQLRLPPRWVASPSIGGLPSPQKGFRIDGT